MGTMAFCTYLPNSESLGCKGSGLKGLGVRGSGLHCLEIYSHSPRIALLGGWLRTPLASMGAARCDCKEPTFSFPNFVQGLGFWEVLVIWIKLLAIRCTVY